MLWGSMLGVHPCMQCAAIGEVIQGESWCKIQHDCTLEAAHHTSEIEHKNRGRLEAPLALGLLRRSPGVDARRLVRCPRGSVCSGTLSYLTRTSRGKPQDRQHTWRYHLLWGCVLGAKPWMRRTAPGEVPEG